MFELCDELAMKPFVMDFDLCRVLLENKGSFPWIILVPRTEPPVENLLTMMNPQLNFLWNEIIFAQDMMHEVFKADKINIGIIGNKTSQLHIHIVARYHHDVAWPNTVWDCPIQQPYPEEEQQEMIKKLRHFYDNFLREYGEY